MIIVNIDPDIFLRQHRLTPPTTKPVHFFFLIGGRCNASFQIDCEKLNIKIDELSSDFPTRIYLIATIKYATEIGCEGMLHPPNNLALNTSYRVQYPTSRPIVPVILGLILYSGCLSILSSYTYIPFYIHLHNNITGLRTSLLVKKKTKPLVLYDYLL